MFAGLYPIEANQYDALRDALEKLQAQRRIAALRAGVVAGARLRLPLRLPRPAAHGHRAGAARARVRHGPDHHRADGGVRGAAARRHRGARSRTRRSCPIRRRSRRSASRSSPRRSSCRRSTSAPVITLCTGKRGVQKNMQYHRPAGDAHLRDAAERSGDGFLRQAEVRLARLRLARLRVQGVPRRPTWSSSTSSSTASASTRCR